jgi:hypothetical protein
MRTNVAQNMFASQEAAEEVTAELADQETN